MKITKLNNQVTVSDQITCADIAELKAAGVEVIVCNRPDGEADDQPTMQEISAAASSEGIEFHEIPFKPSKFSAEDQQRLLAVLKTNKKTHAYSTK